jgi:hypothetical protein
MSVRTVALMVILCCVASMGCSNKNGVPKGILPKDKMEQVMWDMAQADQYAALYLAKDSSRIDRKEETMRLYAEVFRLHQVTPDQFRTSYHYYLDHPELNQLLFDSVITRGVRARSEAYDRPSQYHPPVAPVRPGVGGPSGAKVPMVPFKPGAVRPGAIMPGAARPGGVGPLQQMGSPEMMRRMHEAASRRREDSIMRALQARRDTTKGRP